MFNVNFALDDSLLKLWKVLLLFIIPWGGGIPAGVLLARTSGIAWQMTAFLYLVSDIILAILFEPILLLFLKAGKHIPFLARMNAALKKSLEKTREHYGNITSPFALVMISFGADPMTGRSLAVSAGHGFLSGWLIAITGDMIYFAVLMVSTLWLNSIIGDGTWTTLIIFALMMGVPVLIRRFRKSNGK